MRHYCCCCRELKPEGTFGWQNKEKRSFIRVDCVGRAAGMIARQITHGTAQVEQEEEERASS